MENEEWRDVPGWEGYYQASSMGRVRCKSRYILHKNGILFFKKESVINGWLLKSGYMAVTLSGVGKAKTMLKHQVIAITFLGHAPCGFDKVVNHKNFDRLDNRVENLEIVTARGNVIHKYLKSNNFTGAYSDKDNGRFRSRICVDGKMVHLGTFSSKEDAHSAYCAALDKINNNEIVIENKIPQSSNFKGVYFRRDTKKWVARFYKKGKCLTIGNFKTEIEAINAVESYKMKNA